jgi:hypothetical protein
VGGLITNVSTSFAEEDDDEEVGGEASSVVAAEEVAVAPAALLGVITRSHVGNVLLQSTP